MLQQKTDMGIHEHRRNSASQKLFLLGVVCLLASIAFGPSIPAIRAETTSETKVYGYVIDYATQQPISKAQIGAVNRTTSRWEPTDLVHLMEQQEMIAETDGSGFFEAYVDSFGWYTFFAGYDNESTIGVDYVPAYKEARIEEAPYYASFSLLPGASINITDDPLFSFDESVFLCSIVDKDGLLRLTNSLRQWWEWNPEVGYRTVAVPADTEVMIEIDVFRVFESSFERWNIERTTNFSIPVEGGYLNLKQGEQIPVNLKTARLEAEASITMPMFLDIVTAFAAKVGILSSYERVRISSAEELLTRAQASLSGGDYVAAQTDLYESRLIVEDVGQALRNLFQNSVISIYFITPLMGITSSTLGAIFFKHKSRRIVASVVFYGLFAAILYFAYPGYTFIQTPYYNPLAGTFLESSTMPLLLVSSLLLGLFLINAPYTYGEKTNRRSLSLRSAILATFSLAADNLMRRKLRTVLTTIFMLISVFAFILTTSYSYEGGLVIEQKPGTAPSEGIFVFQQAVERRILPFGPVDEEIVRWLGKRPEVALVVPLLENVPQIGTPPPPLEFLFNHDMSLNFSVSGLLGIIPSLESAVTKIEQILDEGTDTGRFLGDNDLTGILISREAVEALQVSVNETVRLCGTGFTVIGVFDSRKFGALKDLNGDPIIPQEVRVLQTQGGPVYLPNYVAPERVILVLSESAVELPLSIVTSRVDVKTHRKEEVSSLARSLALIFPRVETYTSTNGEIQHLCVGYRQVSRGFAESTVLLGLMVLNVGIMMLNVVYERRREVITMSTIGLNPSQITVIFAFEALVIAFVAGSLGYLLGLTSYVFLGLFPSPPILRYKVEAFWSILALCFSISAAVFGSILPASKASIMATPSLLRRFIITSRERSREGAWTLDVPVRIKAREIREFFDFIEGRLKVYNDPIRYEERVDDIVRERQIYGQTQERMHFVYKFSGSKVMTENELFAVRDAASDEFLIKLASTSLLPWTTITKEASARQTASFVRRLTLEYTERERI